MIRFRLNVIILQALLLISSLTAQNQSTIPTYHWAYPYLHQLRLSGYLEELNTITQPYTHAQVYQSLEILQHQVQQGRVTPSAQQQWLIQLLMKVFQSSRQPSDEEKQLTIQPGIWTDESLIRDQQETRYYTQLRSQLGVNLKERLTFYHGIRLDQSLLDDPDYTGNKWRGFAGYTEQAYIRFTNYDLRITNSESRIPNSEIRFSLGRDFLNWGSGKTGRLLFSDYAQPLDQVSVSFRYKGLQFTMLAVDLDHWNLPASAMATYQAQRANRYLTCHRLTVNFKNKFHLGLAEALLYGGPHANWELKYHNPLLYYHGELLNGGGADGNGLLYLDFDWYPWRNWEFYGELLVDDYQLEKTRPGDLEPNEIGLILGVQHGNWLGLDGSLLGLEYVRIANRTYNSALEWEKFVHFKKPLGYYLGNNLDRWHLFASYWLVNGLQVGLSFDYIRQGQGSILDPWDAPWMNYTVAQGYHEPFPYGTVERANTTSLNLKYHFRSNVIIESQISYRSIENVDHAIGKDQQQWSAMVRLHWDYGLEFLY